MFFCAFSNAQKNHVIQRGETLELIAKRYGISTEVIKKANSLIDEFYAGLTISIPNNSEFLSHEKDGDRKEIKNAKETYKDVLIYELKGHVKTCVWYSKNDTFGSGEFEENHSNEFDYNGKVVCGDGFFIKRDQMNIIIQTRNRVDYEAFLFSPEFHGVLGCDYNYDIDGNVESKIHWRQQDGKTEVEYTSKDIYIYNSKGFVEKIIDKNISGSGRIDLVKEYVYLSFDEYGNWTERKFVDPVNLSEETQKRVITYY